MTRVYLVVILTLSCGPATESAEPAPGAVVSSGSEREPAPVADAAVPRSVVPECDAYLRHYQRCERTLAPSIAAGDRRSYDHERAWLDHAASSPGVADLRSLCVQMTQELQAICP